MSDAGGKVDLRSDPMRSREGAELAVRTWRDTASRLADAALLPVEPAARRVALETVQSSAGFWVMWHREGGFEGMRRIGYSEATIYRKIKSFRESFGREPRVDGGLGSLPAGLALPQSSARRPSS